MNLHQRYLNGETKSAFEDIDKLGITVFDEPHKAEIHKVMKETFERVAFNLRVIYNELIKTGYHFKTDFT